MKLDLYIYTVVFLAEFKNCLIVNLASVNVIANVTNLHLSGDSLTKAVS